MNLKERFEKEVDLLETFQVLVTLVKLPTGAIEVITNTMELENKITYLLNSYDENFCLNANPNVKIVGYVLY